MTLMVDVQYLVGRAEHGRRGHATWRDFDLFFVETPLSVDDLARLRRLHDAGPVADRRRRVADHALRVRGLIDGAWSNVAQPDIGRVGGLTEARRVVRSGRRPRPARRAPRLEDRHLGRRGRAARRCHRPCPFFEFLPPALTGSVLRKELTADELAFHDGVIALPEKPGLGVELNRTALAKYKVA